VRALGYGAGVAGAGSNGDEDGEKDEGDAKAYLGNGDVAAVAVDGVGLPEGVDGRTGGRGPGVGRPSISDKKQDADHEKDDGEDEAHQAL
jgi:hypothetical protein